MKSVLWVLAGGILLTAGGCKGSGEASSSQLHRASTKIQALKDAKDVVIAASDYAFDHGNIFPGPADFKSKVTPYLKPGQVTSVNLFEWTFPGGDMTKVDNFDTVEVGRVRTFGGSAVAYLNGSVQWVEP